MITSDSLRLPPLSCDTHSHIYGDSRAYPVLSGQQVHPNTSLDDYLAVATRLGVERFVLVQPKAYGCDTRCMLDALNRLGIYRARGIIMPDESLSQQELKQLDEAGIRGVRFLFPDNSPLDLAAIGRTARQIASLGWSLIVQGDGPVLAQSTDALLNLPCPVVIDHLGRLPPEFAVDSAEFTSLLTFVSKGGWFKFAAPYYSTPAREADFTMLESRLHALLDAGMERIVWGMNWPHPNFPPDGKPNDLNCLQSLLSVLRSDTERSAVFVHNPASIYGFANT
ncbi:amidohydrolase family protein [Candidimonas sp. SYP-B2681]|uniref:amidohydrolase family protein n=1 Tax=Candidimonas sp. SYP-B2681 TaxID=2497686 RepID=UPI00131544C1|nr:amidohydrolase family protein [Candidimonas sp. SYP-B2681]